MWPPRRVVKARRVGETIFLWSELDDLTTMTGFGSRPPRQACATGGGKFSRGKMTKPIMETGEHLSRQKKENYHDNYISVCNAMYARKHDKNIVCVDDAPRGLIYYIVCVYTNAAGSQQLTLQTSIHLKSER